MNKSNLLANIVFVIIIILTSKITLFCIEQRKEVIISEDSKHLHQVLLSDELNDKTIYENENN